MIDPLQLIGTVGGILGALLVGFRKPWEGHMVWLIANACWMAYGWLASNNYLLILFSVYWVIALIGCYNYRPRRSS